MYARSELRAALLCLMAFASTPLFAQGPPAKKAAIPGASAQAEASQLIKEIYGDELAAAKTPAQKQSLAKKLLEKGLGSESDKTAQFVLVRLSSEIAIQVPDVDTAFEAIADMDNAFFVDALQMKFDALAKIATTASTPAYNKALSQKATEVSDEAVLDGNYTLAKQVSELAVSTARKANDAALVKQSVDRKARTEEFAKAFEEAKAALDVLNKTPLDSAANLGLN